MPWLIAIAVILLILLAVAVRDLLQKRHSILRNFPLIGHGRYLLEELGPKLRQYIVAGNNEERPFSRDQRSWVYRSADRENNYFGFGTDNDLELTPNYLIIKQSTFPLTDTHPGEPGYDPGYRIPCAKVLGEWRDREKKFRPESIINVSAMSYGSLSSAAVEAINRGVKLCGCMQNTGEGGVASWHDQGGDLVWQLGTGYFGARSENGTFDESRFNETCQRFPAIKAIEVKISQGAKPGRGGVLPVFIGSGKLGFPQESLLSMAMGCDMINVARTAMLAIGCIQAQVCHTGKCPTGVATQNAWLMRGLDPADKSVRLANYVTQLRKEILQLSHACGVSHPAMITPDHFEILNDAFQTAGVRETFRLQGVTTIPSESDCANAVQLMERQ